MELLEDLLAQTSDSGDCNPSAERSVHTVRLFNQPSRVVVLQRSLQVWSAGQGVSVIETPLLVDNLHLPLVLREGSSGKPVTRHEWPTAPARVQGQTEPLQKLQAPQGEVLK